MPSALDHQRAAAALILGSIGEDAFALAGSGATREHGVIHRHAPATTRLPGLNAGTQEGIRIPADRASL